MGKSTTTTHFFKRKNLNDSKASASDATLPTTNANIPIPENVDITIPENVNIPISESVDIPIPENPQPKFQKIDTNSLEQVLRLHQQIWDYHVNQHDEIRRAYIDCGPLQPHLTTYKKSIPENHRHSFQCTWFKLFLSWLDTPTPANIKSWLHPWSPPHNISM